MFTVYEHICPNGKRYIGLTSRPLTSRWENGKHYEHNLHFTNAIKKYSWDNIQHNIIATGLTKEEACKVEQFFIQWYDTTNQLKGYNVSKGGECGLYGVKFTQEHKDKISVALTGISRPKGRDNPNYGKHLSNEQKDKMRIAHTGKHLSQEHKDKIGLANIGKSHKISEEQKRKIATPVVQYDLQGNIINTYYGICEASRQTGIAQSTISMAISGKRRTAGGFIWVKR